MNGSALQLALREVRKAFSSPLELGGMGLAIVVLSLSGPFGTFQSFDLAQRFAYWAATVVACYGVGQLVGSAAMALLPQDRLPRWPRVIAAGLITGVPVTLAVLAVNAVAYRSWFPADPVSVWLYATTITVVVMVALVLISDRIRAAEGTAPSEPRRAAILDRVPLPQRGRLVALVVEDHYVDIVTDKGKALVLMRLADAIRETGDVAGLRVHRSHWVARDAVARVHKSDGKVTLELKTGLRLPVPRSSVPRLREAGLL